MAKACTFVGLTAVLLIVAIGTAGAEPALPGYSGLLMAPTADALNRNQYSVSLNSSEVSDFEDRGYILNFGLADDIEGGLLWFHPEHGPSRTLINIKHRFERGSARRASLAVGVADLTDEVDTSVYVAATKQLGRQVGIISGRPVHMLRVHAGVGSGMFDDFFFGAEARLGRRMTLMAEHVNDQVNVGARLRLWQNFTVDAGVLDMDDVAVSLSYNYPLQGTEQLTPMISEPSRTTSTTSVPAQAEHTSVNPAAVAETSESQPTTATTVASLPTKELKELTKTAAPSTAEVEASTAEPEEEAAAAPVTNTTEQTPPKPPAAATPQQPQPAASVDPSKSVVEIPLRGLCPDVGSGHVFLPVRSVAEWLGFKVAGQFTPRGLQVTVFAGVDAAQFYVGDNQVTINGKSTQLPVATYLHKSKVTMVPAEFFALLGVPVQADAQAGHALLERHDVVGGIFLSK